MTIIYWVLKDGYTHDVFGIFEEAFEPLIDKHVIIGLVESVGHHNWYWAAVEEMDFDTLKAFGIKEYFLPNT